ncbi:hypothetical protein C8R46DRAFT_1081438, partial [Mycena filopes]
MSRPRTTTGIRIDNITAYLTPALALLDQLNDAFGLPYVQPIIRTIQTLIVGVQVWVATQIYTITDKEVQNVKRNKDECFQLVESIHQVLYPFIQLHLKSETLGTGPLWFLRPLESSQKHYTRYTCSFRFSRMGTKSNNSFISLRPTDCSKNAGLDWTTLYRCS